MTAATSALVAGTLAVYALIDLRRTETERRERFEEDTRTFAHGIRTSLEQTGVARALDETPKAFTICPCVAVPLTMSRLVKSRKLARSPCA